MYCRDRVYSLSWIYWLASCALVGLPTEVLAQITPDSTLGTGNNSTTAVQGNRTDITGGLQRSSTLFHSFSQFNVGTNQQVYFANPVGIRNIFSRVTGSNLSTIDGLLGVAGSANLFLMNPNGIIFGPNARLDVSGSFVATTASVVQFPDNQRFEATGDRQVPLVEVNIPIGLQVGATPPAMLTGNLVAGLQYSGMRSGADITNAGNLAVGSGQNLTLLGSTTTSTGSLTASGGTVQVLGDRVALLENARIDVSSPTGGGTVLVGGDYQGKGTVPTATQTVVGAGVEIHADALNQGDGGTAIIWSDGTTQFGGRITAKGGVAGGSGGFVETSGKQSLTVSKDAKVNTTAFQGQAGTWLLDPTSITVVASGGTDATVAAANANAGASTIDYTVINTALGSGSVILAATNFITVGTGTTLSIPTATTLTLNAATVNLNAPIASTGTGTLAGNPTTVNVNAGAGVQNGVDVAASGATVNVATGSYSGDVNVSKPLNLAFGGAGVTVGGNFATNAGGTVGLSGTLTANGASGINFNDAIALNGAVNLTSTGGINFANTVNGSHNLGITGNASFGSTTNLTSLNVSGTTQFNGNVTTTGTQTYTGAVTLGTDTTLQGSTVTFSNTVNGSHNLGITGNASFGSTVGNTTNLTSLNVSGTTGLNGNVTTTGTQTYTGAVTLGSSTITLEGSSLSLGTGLTGAGNNLTLDFTSSVNPVSSNITGVQNFTSQGAGGTSLSGTFTTTGTQTYNNAVTLTGNTLLQGSSLSLGTGLTGAGNDLTLDFTSSVNPVSSNITGVQNFTSQGTGGTSLGGTFTTTGTQTYNNAVTLTGPTVLNATGNLVRFGNTLNSDGTNRSLNINTGNAQFDGVVGGSSPLSSLSVSGTTTLNGNVTTTGTQTYTGAVTLAGNTLLQGSSLSLGTGLIGAGNDLTLDFTSSVNPISSNITGVQNFTSQGTGGTSLGGTFTTTGTQTYNNAVTLTGPTVLNATGNLVRFGNTLNSDGTNRSLDINTGNAQFDNAVGASSALSSLTVNGTAAINGNVTTTGTQTYNNTVTVTGDRTLTADDLVFNNTVTGTGNLTLQPFTLNHPIALNDPAAIATLNLSQTELNNLKGFNTVTIGRIGSPMTVGNGGAIDLSTNAQPFNLTLQGANLVFANNLTLNSSENLTVQNSSVTLGNNTQLIARDITFDNAITGNHNLTIQGTGNVTTRSISTSGTSGGNVLLQGTTVTVNGNIYTNGNGGGNGGNVTLQGVTNVTLNGRIDPAAFGTGKTGDTNITATNGNVNLNSGILYFDVFGSSGNVIVNASSSLNLNQFQIIGTAYGISPNPGGTATLTANTINLTNSSVSANSSSGVAAGNISVTAQENVTLNNSKLTTSATGVGGKAGSITLDVKTALTMENNSLISTEGLGGANGGNISILNVTLAIAKPAAPGSNGNDIVARAIGGGVGGNILFKPPLIQGFRIGTAVPGNGTNDIDSNGNVNTSTTGVDVTRGITSPQIIFTDISQIVSNACEAVGAKTNSTNSELRIAGHGGVPSSPTAPLSAQSTSNDWVSLELTPQVPVGMTLPNGSTVTLEPGHTYQMQAVCVNAWKAQHQPSL